METARLKWLPWIVGLAFFMQWFDTGALNNILPAIAREFSKNPMQMQSLVLGFMLTMVLLMPLSGWMGDRFGIRTVFMSSVIVFMVGSVVCAFSQGIVQLLAGKIMQGAGAAFLLPVSRLAILRSFDRDRLTALLSFIAVPGLVGTFLGPILAGLFVAWLSWRWVFYCNIPIGLLILFCAGRVYPVYKKEVHGFDIIGFLLVSLTVVSATLCIEGYVDWHWSAWLVWISVAVALAAVLGYCLYARWSVFPLFDLKVFRIRTFSIGLIGNLINGFTGGAVPFLVPLMLQVELGLSASQTGIVMASGALSSIFAKNVVPFLLKKTGYRWFISINTVVLGIVILLFTVIDVQTPFGLLMLCMAMFSGLNSFQFTSTFTMSLIDLGQENASNGNTLVSLLCQFFAGISVGVVTILLSCFSPEGLRHVPLQVFHHAFICIALVNVIAVLFFLRAPHGFLEESIPHQRRC